MLFNKPIPTGDYRKGINEIRRSLKDNIVLEPNFILKSVLITIADFAFWKMMSDEKKNLSKQNRKSFVKNSRITYSRSPLQVDNRKRTSLYSPSKRLFSKLSKSPQKVERTSKCKKKKISNLRKRKTSSVKHSFYNYVRMPEPPKPIKINKICFFHETVQPR